MSSNISLKALLIMVQELLNAKDYFTCPQLTIAPNNLLQFFISICFSNRIWSQQLQGE